MRVVQLLPELNEGGVERGVVELNREFVKRGIESLVVSAGGMLVKQIDIDGGKHHSFDVASKNILTVPLRVFRLRRLLKELKPDILHARSRVPAWLAYLANKGLEIPFVTTVHGFNSVNSYSRVMTYGDKVICVSSAIKNYIQQHYQVPDGKTVVIPRGVDLELFNPDRVDRHFIDQFSKQYALKDKYVISIVGRITQLKDIETFIRAISIARESRQDIVALIVGGVHSQKQAYYQKLLKLVATLSLEESVFFVGTQEKVSEIYALSDVVVSSSKKPESFGRTAAEAMATGTPVLATSHGGVLDIVKEGLTGALFPPGDHEVLAAKILQLKNDSKCKLRLHIVENFSLVQMVEKTLAVYQELKG